MTDTTHKYLLDILTASEKIDLFLQDCSGYSQYKSDLKTKSAVERQLAIIGEATTKIRQQSPHLSLGNSQQISAFRNRLIHAYDSIDDSMSG